MLQHTFCHIPGIGFATEQKLWQAGIHTWQDWCDQLPVRISTAVRMDAEQIISESLGALDNTPRYFTDRLSSSDPWRIFAQYRDRTVYLDIETTGLDDYAEITTIALYDGDQVFTYVNGQNLYDFVQDIEKYQVIVSYNGKSFDIPFLERYFRIKLEHAQIDLRYTLARLGFTGGLKGCEKQLGLNRGNLDGVDGYFAVLLWREYQRTGDSKVLDTLLAYNIEDTVNLERLAVEAYNRNVLNTPFSDRLLLDCPAAPPNPKFADQQLIERLKGSFTGNW